MHLHSRSLRSFVGSALIASLSFSGCQPEPKSQPAQPATSQTQALKAQSTLTSPDAPQKVTIEDRAKALLTQAWSHEPKVTALLKALSAELGGRMVGLEYRLKTEGSTIRKLKKISAEHPETPIAELSIYDALRYTIEASDEPAGKHVKLIQTALSRLESAGFKVKTVKNYWPKGDNYSGVNTVLSTADGFEWELQFHTPESVQESRRSHKQYEELRAQDTPPARRLELFKAMSAPWEQIPVPASILEEKNLHAQELLKSLPAPSNAP